MKYFQIARWLSLAVAAVLVATPGMADDDVVEEALAKRVDTAVDSDGKDSDGVEASLQDELEEDTYFEVIDADQDGDVAEEEFTFAVSARTQRRVERADTDQDGKISLAEWIEANGGAESAEAQFKKTDRNGDGYVTGEEVELHVTDSIADRFAVFDVNGDGTLSKEELKAARPSEGGVE